MQITCVVDDAVRRSSRFWGEHGLAFLIQAGGKRVLFDTGQSGTVLLHNLALLDVDPSTIDALAISHAHHDHTGGLEALLEHLRPGIPLYANPDLFRERFSQREGKLKAVGLSITQERLAQHVKLVLNAAPQKIIPGVWTTGEINERREREGSSEYHLMRDGPGLVPDAYGDDMALVLQSPDNLVLLCGCCHAGLLNTVASVKCLCTRPITAIIGGLHLASASNDDLRHISDQLWVMPALQGIYPNHCSGEPAFAMLTQALGAYVVNPCPAGTVLQS
jgi:7,8-dihydropterin-6-yl-methyl-4-(beta-D-ribofuranosyl)aminobenzene 5'-phosphate synthase